ncbi:MAG: tyrosine-protein phosphatase [Enterococcus sp.]
MTYVRLPLKNTYNTRELGGYSTKTGQTKWHTFLRSDDLHQLEPVDFELLQRYGITKIIDLRSEGELQRAPHPENSPFDYLNIPLAVGDITDMTQVDYANYTLIEGYKQMIEASQAAIKQVFDCLVEQTGVLFHCAGGKDRTGIIAALILGSVGVAKEDIIANYQTTATYLAQNPALVDMVKEFSSDISHLGHSDAQTMKELLDFIDEKYQDIPTYLAKIGVSKNQQRQLQALFVTIN